MKFWQVDAFTSQPFHGNPAAVFLLDSPKDSQWMEQIAREMNLSETAFVIRGKTLRIRWFTPKEEVALCGHATLAAAHVLWQEGHPTQKTLTFDSLSGPLHVRHYGEGRYTLDFPLQDPDAHPDLIPQIHTIVGCEPLYVGCNGHDCMAVIADASEVRSFVPDLAQISELPNRGFLLTAASPSEECDYIYRAFFPKLHVPEDPVTGSANTCLAPYWAKCLGKQKLRAHQVSERGGELLLEIASDRLYITGNAITIFEGELKF